VIKNFSQVLKLYRSGDLKVTSNIFSKFLALFAIVPVLIFAESSQDELVEKQRIDMPNGGMLMPYLGVSHLDDLFPNIRQVYDLNIGGSISGFTSYAANFPGDDPNLKKIIVFENCKSNYFSNLPKSKLVLFRIEATKMKPPHYEPFSIVYTMDDDLVDGVKFFKYYYPSLLPILPELVPFEEKKLCTMIASNWTIERVKIAEFFETKPEGEFEFYGYFRAGRSRTVNLANSKMYKGRIPGNFSSSDKLAILANYRFCICFENRHNTRGYISEKIFHCFAAGCVPVYWGPDNVEDYIPKSCFIDYRDFQSDEELYQFIKNMPRKTYERYLKNIRAFLKSPQAHLFSPEHFEQTVYEAVNR
jgi:hypothetical protein